MQGLVAFARAIADETRFRVIHLLMERTLCVCELADILNLPQSTLSSQLRVIQQAELLACERQGKWLFYRVDPTFRPLLRELFSHFDISPATDQCLAQDQSRALKRIADRDESCCPPSSTDPSCSRSPSRSGSGVGPAPAT